MPTRITRPLRALRRILVASSLAAALLVAGVSSTLAAKPERFVLEPGEPFLIEAACEFDVLVEDLKVGYAIMTFERPDGSTMIIAAGQWLIRLTNVETGESLVTTISGPELIRFDGEELISDMGTGRWILTDVGEGMWLTSGRIALSAGTVTDIRATLKGHADDLCARLAA